MDVDNLKILKTFVTDTPLNTAALTPKKDFVILGGGQEARDVTTTSQRQGKFEARFYHKIFEDEIGRVRGHFGPLNTVRLPNPTLKHRENLCVLSCLLIYACLLRIYRLPSTLKEPVTLLVQRTDMCECTTLISRTLISRMKWRG